jgi:mRNA interferase RelE/StbE
MYEIQFSNQAKKFIKNLDSNRKEKIKEVIDNLKKDAFAYPYKKLVNSPADFRIRVGEYRISYSFFKNKLLIRIIKIGKRENFYS